MYRLVSLLFTQVTPGRRTQPTAPGLAYPLGSTALQDQVVGVLTSSPRHPRRVPQKKTNEK